MTFAARVIRMKKGAGGGLTEGDKSNDPAVVASANIELAAEKETGAIGAPRASSLYGACMRMHVLGTKFNRTKTQWSSFRGKLTFGIGNALHFWMQNEPDLFGDRRRGWWRCAGCNRIRYFGAPPKTKCEFCGARKEATFYQEHFMELRDPFMVTGHQDLFLEKRKGVFRVIEAKTMAGHLFEKLKAPMAQDEWQLQTYMWGSQLDKKLPVEIDHDVGYLCYIAKQEFAKMLPVKMFPIEKNQYTLNLIKGKLKQYKDGMKHFPEKLPPKSQTCIRNPSGYAARQCPVGDLCEEFHHD